MVAACWCWGCWSRVLASTGTAPHRLAVGAPLTTWCWWLAPLPLPSGPRVGSLGLPLQPGAVSPSVRPWGLDPLLPSHSGEPWHGPVVAVPQLLVSGARELWHGYNASWLSVLELLLSDSWELQEESDDS